MAETWYEFTSSQKSSWNLTLYDNRGDIQRGQNKKKGKNTL